jgi:hypothetical protein
MNTASNVVDFASYRQRTIEAVTEQEVIDDISASTFLYLRDEAALAGVSIPAVIAEHMLGIALVVESVEGTASARALLAAVSEQLGMAD